MTRSDLYDSYISFGHTGSENSKEFKEWAEKMEALNEERLDTMFELIANGLKNAIKTSPIEDRIDC